MDEGRKNNCHSCGVSGPWVGLPAGPPCFCDDTWFRRACLWSRSKKGWWFCSRCFDASADQAQALATLCVHCRFKVSEALRIQTQRNQADAMINFRSIHMQHFQNRTHENKFNRATGNYVGRPKPTENTQELRMVNGKWQLIQKTGADDDARALRDKMGIKAKSSRSPSRSRSRSRAKRKKRKKSSSSSSSSRSSSSSTSRSPVKVSASNAGGESKTAGDKEESGEVAKVKSEVLNKILKLKEIESKEARQKEFRSLLRAWHPDKNPDKVEVATVVFQFLQKGKQLLD